VRALEPMPGVRVVGHADALDRLAFPGGVTVLRIAPDELIAVGMADGPTGDAILGEAETGFVGRWLDAGELAAVRRHVEWPLHDGLNQGLVAGVPARVWIGDDGRALLLVAGAYAHELETRL